jgi:hypothetical protein
MLEDDFSTFDRAFKRLAGLFRLRVIGAALDELSRSYFKILEAGELHDVLEAGKVCVQTRRVFPKPVDWLEALPKPNPTPRHQDDAIGSLSHPEAIDWQRAESLRWEDTPCACVACQMAGMSATPLRFVPETVAVDDLRDRRMRDPIRNRIVVAGHWAHGDELARWYAARARFFSVWVPAVARRRMAPELALVHAGREPGEEG